MNLGTILMFLMLLLPATASAVTNDICGHVYFQDSRTNLSSLTGSRVKPPSLGLYGAQYAPRVLIYLFDERGSCNDADSNCYEADDLLLGSTYTNATSDLGHYCFYDVPGTADVYLKTRYESDDTEVRDSTGSLFSATSTTRENFVQSGDQTLDWNISCPRSVYQSSCYYVSAPEESFAAILMSAVDVDYLIIDDGDFHRNGHSGKITLYYPDDPGSACDGDDTRSFDCNGICIEDASALNNHAVYHEIGHALMKRTLNYCDYLGGPSCDSHSWSTWEDEKCATSEGWANFVALATQYWPSESQAWVFSVGWNAEGSTTSGNSSASRCVSLLTNPHRREGNVARFFWDLYDTTSVFDTTGGYTDDAAWSFHSILVTWDYFPAGTANRKNNESDDNGRNAYDYTYYAPSAQGEMHVNCLENQDTQ